MISADTIPLITDESNTDYSRLRNDGLAMLQQLAGSIWTDYNEHDPGVTILEELCYVLTELNYLSQQPIQNLLTLKDGTFPAASNAFYTAATILHNSPLIVNDYRKLIADRLPEVSNVWVYPYYLKNMDENSPEYGVSGLYRVVVDLNVGELPLTGLNTHPVKDLLKHYRNMGELFPVVTYLQQEALSLSGSVYVDDATRIDDILAKMLVVVEDYLKPGIPFYTLEELMEEGYPVEKIFEGPKLRSGFVKDEDLVDQVTEVYADNLLKLILSDGAGASNVADLRVVDADGTEYMYFSVADGTSVYLDKMATLEKITVICRGITVQVRKRTVMLRYNEYRTQRNVQRSLRQTKQATDLPIPQGKYLNPESYYSIQNEFPGIYGTGEQRLPIDATEDRKARTLQLKAFLLFFEQLLADYRSQVEHMHQLFSSHPQEKTYFYQPLYNVPDVAPLLKGYPGKAEDIYASDHKNSYALDTKTYLQNPNPYTEGLADLYAMNDDFGDRREMFLQHLLARFNFAPFLFSDSENTQNDLVSVPAELNLCEELLRLLPAITMNRGRASEYDSNAGMASGLEQLVHCLSGIFNEHYAAYGNSEELCLQLGDSETDGPLFKETRSHRVHVVINPVHPDFFAALYAGLQISNFVRDTTGEGALSLMVGNVSDPGGKRKYLLRTWSPDYGMATTWEELDLLTQEFSVMYRYFERFYIIDHISLLPPLTQAVFGWRLPPNSGITGVKTESNLSYEELQRSIWGALSDYPQTAPDVYVRQTDNSETDSDFYSFKTSVIVPAKAMLLRGDSISGRAFSQYFRFVLHSNSPLHLVVNVFELDDARYRQFLELRHSTAPDAKSQMTLFLQELWNNKL